MEVKGVESITTDEFIDGIKNLKTLEELTAYMNQHFFRNIITPYDKKVELMHNLAFATCTAKDEEGNIYFYSNSSTRHVMFILTILNLYSDLKIDVSDGVNEYMKFEKNNLLRNLFNYSIPRNEYDEFKEILDREVNDMILNLKKDK